MGQGAYSFRPCSRFGNVNPKVHIPGPAGLFGDHGVDGNVRLVVEVGGDRRQRAAVQAAGTGDRERALLHRIRSHLTDAVGQQAAVHEAVAAVQAEIVDLGQVVVDVGRGAGDAGIPDGADGDSDGSGALGHGGLGHLRHGTEIDPHIDDGGLGAPHGEHGENGNGSAGKHNFLHDELPLVFSHPKRKAPWCDLGGFRLPALERIPRNSVRGRKSTCVP
jgi:hypothetical protein